MTKTGWANFDTPCDQTLSAPTSGGAQQIEISAAHELQARPYQSNRPATRVIRFPGRTGWNTSGAEQDFGNLAIRRTGKMTVKSAEAQHKLLTLQACERIGWWAVPLARQQSPEPQRGISASGKICVKRGD